MRSKGQYYEDLILLTENQLYNFVAVAYLYEKIKHWEEIVLENDVPRNSLHASKIASFDDKKPLKCAMWSIQNSPFCQRGCLILSTKTNDN